MGFEIMDLQKAGLVGLQKLYEDAFQTGADYGSLLEVFSLVDKDEKTYRAQCKSWASYNCFDAWQRTRERNIGKPFYLQLCETEREK